MNTHEHFQFNLISHWLLALLNFFIRQATQTQHNLTWPCKGFLCIRRSRWTASQSSRLNFVVCSYYEKVKLKEDFSKAGNKNVGDSDTTIYFRLFVYCYFVTFSLRYMGHLKWSIGCKRKHHEAINWTFWTSN